MKLKEPSCSRVGDCVSVIEFVAPDHLGWRTFGDAERNGASDRRGLSLSQGDKRSMLQDELLEKPDLSRLVGTMVDNYVELSPALKFSLPV